MRKSRFSEEQIIGILKEHQAGIGAKELCRKHGISDGTFYKWRSKYGGMEVSEAQLLKTLEAGNAKLKKVLAEHVLDVTTFKEMLGKTSEARRKATRCGPLPGRRFGKAKSAEKGAMTEKNYNQRRACALAGIDPRVYRRVSTRPADGALRDRLKELSNERRRFGYRRLHLLLGRQGWKLYPIYRDEGLTVRKRGGRKRAIGTRAPITARQAIAKQSAERGEPAGAEPEVVLGLRLRQPVGWTAVPCARRHR